jgi:hypothetical protein
MDKTSEKMNVFEKIRRIADIHKLADPDQSEVK